MLYIRDKRWREATEAFWGRHGMLMNVQTRQVCGETLYVKKIRGVIMKTSPLD